MGFVGFLKFALKFCIDFLAWPLFALGCPLYASVQAIESNSNSDIRNLVAYWIIFSLISLFELAFVKLIEWLPFWPYLKLMTICWLVLPHFDGACYVYEHLVRPCLSLNPEVIINQFVKPKKDLSLNADSFLAVAERYVKENGSEALEKLIATKSKHTEPSVEVKEIKAATNTEEKETAAATDCKIKEPDFVKEDAKAVELTEKNPVDSTKSSKCKEPNVIFQSKCKEPNVAMEDAKSGELREKNVAAATERVKCAEPNLAQTEKNTVAAGEIKEKKVVAENKVSEIPASEKFQKEWACAVCQVKTTCEGNLNSHLQGKKHKANCKALEASKQASKNKGCPSSIANQEPKISFSGDIPNQNKTKKQEDKVNVNQTSEQCKQKVLKNTGSGANESKLWCRICNVKCLSEIDMVSHFNGKKHLSQIQGYVIDSLGRGD